MPASNSPIPYTGNKSCIIDTILAVMPEHSIYIEPCMGSAEVFLRKKPAKTEIINDYNGDLVNFFRVLQSNEKLAFLLGRLYLSANSELIFHQNKDLLKGTPNILDDVAGTAKKVYDLSWNDVQLAAAFLENQVYSFRSTGDAFAIAKRLIRDRFNRLIAANERLGEATILHRDYKDAIIYGAKPGAFIMLDPPYKGTEDYYRKSNFDENQHAELFRFMAEEVDQKFGGECKFLITYNNDPYIRYLADMYGLDTFVRTRLHAMRQDKEAGALFEELLIANYDLKKQAKENHRILQEERNRYCQLTLFDYKSNYYEEDKT